MRQYFDGQPIDIGSVGEVYSTEEIRIGTWIDGKPLYRKVYEATSLSNSDFQRVVTLPSGVSYTNVKNIYGYMDIQSTHILGPMNVYDNEELSRSLFVQNNYILMRVVGNVNYNNPVTIIAEYTKTTDQSAISFQSDTSIDTLLPDTTSVTSFAKKVNVSK